jgi:hypothetical protein
MAKVRPEKIQLGRRELDPPRHGKAEIREVEAPTVGEDIPEVRVKMQKPPRIHEGNIGSQASLRHGARQFDGLDTIGDFAQPAKADPVYGELS